MMTMMMSQFCVYVFHCSDSLSWWFNITSHFSICSLRQCLHDTTVGGRADSWTDTVASCKGQIPWVGLKTADHRRTNRRPPQDSTELTAEHTAGRGK